MMSKTFPKSRFNGYDFSKEAITAGLAEAKHLKLKNVYFEIKDVTSLQETAKYDLITAFDAIYDQVRTSQMSCIS